ncbi:nuclear envelope pore membrane protein POM 121-like [Dipodomys merriami]|uniref:nuclear envelope pore membrane protein POM 121-like n=1 Tax=Dipodomys merriami TaxID=94247 RepID=UPI003855B8E5
MGAYLDKTGLSLPADSPAQDGTERHAPAGPQEPSASKSIPLLSSWAPMSLLRAGKRPSRGHPAAGPRRVLSSPRRRYLLQQARRALLGPLAAVCWNQPPLQTLSRRLCSALTPRMPAQHSAPAPPPAQAHTTDSCEQSAPSSSHPHSGDPHTLTEVLQDRKTKTMAADHQDSDSDPQRKRPRQDGAGDGEISPKPPKLSQVLSSESFQGGLAAQGSRQPSQEQWHPSSGRPMASGRAAGKPGSGQKGRSCRFASTRAGAQLGKRSGLASLFLPGGRLAKKAWEERLPPHSRTPAAAMAPVAQSPPVQAPDAHFPTVSNLQVSNKIQASKATFPGTKRRVRFKIKHSQSACAAPAETANSARPGPASPALPKGHRHSSLASSASHSSTTPSISTQATATKPVEGSVGAPPSGPLCTEPAAADTNTHQVSGPDTATPTVASGKSDSHSDSEPAQGQACATTLNIPRGIIWALLYSTPRSPVSLPSHGHFSKRQGSPSSVAPTCSNSTGCPSPRSPSSDSTTSEGSLSFNRTARPAFQFPSTSRVMPTLRIHTKGRTKLPCGDNKPVPGCSWMPRVDEAADTTAQPGPATAQAHVALGSSVLSALGCQKGPASTFWAPASMQPSQTPLTTIGCRVTSQPTTTPTISSRIASCSQAAFPSGSLAASAGHRVSGLTGTTPGPSSPSGAFFFPASICVSHGQQQPLC